MIAYMLSLLSMKERIVVDTSVIIRALIGKRGAGREILRQCLHGHYIPLISNALFQEYEDVISRERIRKLTPLSDKEVRELLNAFYRVCQWVPIYFLWRPNLKDEGDNFLIELAVAGNSKAIVTYNIKDLEGAELNFRDLKIMKPEQVLRGI